MEGSEFRRRMSRGGREQEIVVRELIPELRRRVNHALFKAGLARDHLDDILQEICVEILTGWQNVRSDGSIWGWISTIAYHAAVDVQRHHAKQRPLDDAGDDTEADPGQRPILPGSGSNPSGVYEPRHDQSDCIRRVFAALDREGPARSGSTRTIEILQFSVLKGDDVDDLAAYLKCKRHAAVQRRSYALQKVRELCARFCGEDHCGVSLERA